MAFIVFAVGTVIVLFLFQSKKWVLSGHLGEIRTVTCTRDGSRIVSTSDDGTVRVWSVQDGAQLCEVSGLEFSKPAMFRTASSGTYINNASDRVYVVTTGGIIQCFDIATGKHLGDVETGSDQVALAEQSPVALVVGKQVTLWNVEEAVSTAVLSNVNGTDVAQINIGKDGQLMAVIDHFGLVKTWDVASSMGPIEFHCSTSPPRCTAISSATKTLAIGSNDGMLRVWTMENGIQVSVFRHPGPVLAVVFSPIEDFVVTGCDDGKVRLWDVRHSSEYKEVGTHPGRTCIHALCFSPDGRYVLSGGGNPYGLSLSIPGPDRNIRRWKIRLPSPQGGTSKDLSQYHQSPQSAEPE